MKDIRDRVVRELLAKFPTVPSLTLAKALFNQDKGLWSSVERCRDWVRRRRGNNGASRRMADHRFYRSPGHQRDGNAYHRLNPPELVVAEMGAALSSLNSAYRTRRGTTLVLDVSTTVTKDRPEYSHD